MTDLLHTKLGDIRDADLLRFIEELEQAQEVGSHGYVDFSLLHYLTQCVHPLGPERRVPIAAQRVPAASLLATRVGKLPEGAVRALCAELAALAKTAWDTHHGSRVYVLLNKTLPKFPRPPKPGSRRQRWDAVIRQRRTNR